MEAVGVEPPLTGVVDGVGELLEEVVEVTGLATGDAAAPAPVAEVELAGVELVAALVVVPALVVAAAVEEAVAVVEEDLVVAGNAAAAAAGVAAEAAGVAVATGAAKGVPFAEAAAGAAFAAPCATTVPARCARWGGAWRGTRRRTVLRTRGRAVCRRSWCTGR